MNEPTKQFKEIFESHHDPETQLLKRLQRRKQDMIDERREDLGLDITKTS